MLNGFKSLLLYVCIACVQLTAAGGEDAEDRDLLSKLPLFFEGTVLEQTQKRFMDIGQSDLQPLPLETLSLALSQKFASPRAMIHTIFLTEIPIIFESIKALKWLEKSGDLAKTVKAQKWLRCCESVIKEDLQHLLSQGPLRPLCKKGTFSEFHWSPGGRLESMLEVVKKHSKGLCATALNDWAPQVQALCLDLSQTAVNKLNQVGISVSKQWLCQGKVQDKELYYFLMLEYRSTQTDIHQRSVFGPKKKDQLCALIKNVRKSMICGRCAVGCGCGARSLLKQKEGVASEDFLFSVVWPRFQLKMTVSEFQDFCVMVQSQRTISADESGVYMDYWQRVKTFQDVALQKGAAYVCDQEQFQEVLKVVMGGGKMERLDKSERMDMLWRIWANMPEVVREGAYSDLLNYITAERMSFPEWDDRACDLSERFRELLVCALSKSYNYYYSSLFFVMSKKRNAPPFEFATGSNVEEVNALCFTLAGVACWAACQGMSDFEQQMRPFLREDIQMVLDQVWQRIGYVQGDSQQSFTRIHQAGNLYACLTSLLSKAYITGQDVDLCAPQYFVFLREYVIYLVKLKKDSLKTCEQTSCQRVGSDCRLRPAGRCTQCQEAIHSLLQPGFRKIMRELRLDWEQLGVKL